MVAVAFVRNVDQVVETEPAAGKSEININVDSGKCCGVTCFVAGVGLFLQQVEIQVEKIDVPKGNSRNDIKTNYETAISLERSA